jgi:hypothetical protein
VTRITCHALFSGFGLWASLPGERQRRTCSSSAGSRRSRWWARCAGRASAPARPASGRDRCCRSAILAGRQKLVLGELSWLAVGLGAAVGVGLYLAHDAWFR